MGLNLIIIGTIIALVLILLYTVKKWNTAEIEKATLAKTKVALDSKVKALEDAAIEDEREKRRLERAEEAKYAAGPVDGDLFLREDKDRLN